MRKFAPLLVLLMLQLSLLAQDKAFTVVAVQGKVAVAGKGLSIGQQISGDASVVITDAGYVGLLHKSGNSVEFKTKGTFNLKPYNDKLAASTKGFQEKYMDYVVSGMTKKSSGGSYQKNMGVTGSVDRALAKNDILIPLPQKVVLMGSNIDLEWMDELKTAEYRITFKNMKEEELLNFNTSKKFIAINLKDLNLEPEQYYLVAVTDAAGTRKSNTVNFYVPSANERTILSNDLEAISSTLDMNSSVGLMAYAQICEEKGLFIEAYACYRKAREISPDIDYFSEAYKNFMDNIVAQL